MSESNIPLAVKLRIWARAGGRCQYRGCNEDLTKDELTGFAFNAAYLAHIVGDSIDGPRGDPIESPRLAKAFSNVMLMCDKHHRLIDVGDLKGHPTELLRAMKRESETRIANVVFGSAPDTKTEILRYAANIGEQSPVLSMKDALEAITPEYHSASDDGFGMQLLNSLKLDSDNTYWSTEEEHLKISMERMIRLRQTSGFLPRLSIFAFAPQPLLIRLGSFLSDIPHTDIYQLHREPRTWRWGDQETDIDFSLEKQTHGTEPVLVFSLSATITNDRIHSVLKNASIWQFTVKEPSRDLIKSRHHLKLFREAARKALDKIKALEGHTKILNVFPAMPVSTAVEFGRVRMPKADMTVRIYDEIKGSGFIPTLVF